MIRARTKWWTAVAVVVALMAHAGIADAQRRGGGGGGRGGGGGISRQGPAAGGGFSQRSRPTTAAPAQRSVPASRPQTASTPAGQRPEARPQDAQLAQGGTADQQGNRHEERTERQGTRQEERTERQENRQEAYDDINVYYPPYGGYHYDDDWDNWDVAVGVVVGGVVGAAVASDDDDDDDDDDEKSAIAGPNSSLPCNPTVMQVEGVTYYQCGQTYYVQAYGGDGPIYMPVPPPG